MKNIYYNLIYIPKSKLMNCRKTQPLHIECISIKRVLLNGNKSVYEKLERALADEKSIKIEITTKIYFEITRRLKGERVK